jgi:hypothetical protein
MATPMAELAAACDELQNLQPTNNKLGQAIRFIELGEQLGLFDAVTHEVNQQATAKLAKSVQGLVATLTANP